MTAWWRSFFRPSRFPIDELIPASKTAEEVRALKRLLPPRPAAVLDVCCGTGRHAVGLARAGYSVVGADQSGSYLASARRKARGLRGRAAFVRRDMRRLGYDRSFDAALNLWTSFGYFESPAEDVRALRSIRRALKPGGRLILEIVDGDHVKRNLQRRYWSPAGRGWLLEENEFRGGKDPAVVSERITIAPDGRWRASPTFVRHYDAARLKRVLAAAGFSRVKVGPGLLEPNAPASARKRLLAVAWRS